MFERRYWATVNLNNPYEVMSDNSLYKLGCPPFRAGFQE